MEINSAARDLCIFRWSTWGRKHPADHIPPSRLVLLGHNRGILIGADVEELEEEEEEGVELEEEEDEGEELEEEEEEELED